MSYPWKGKARPMSPDAFKRAAESLQCDETAIRAVWSVESSGRGFLADGSLIRRFEPHHMPGSTMNWRDSLKISTSRREQMFLEAYRKSPEAALRAASFGGPQIMGFNHKASGYASADDMVRAMANDEDAHLEAFVNLIKSWGLDSALIAHDWLTFATRYNGNGQAPKYARKIEQAYRRISGKSSPTVLRIGSRGSAVRKLQQALGIADDGIFGPETEKRVVQFQEDNGLAVDGVVGHETWKAITAKTRVKPEPQPTEVDDIADKVKTWGGAATAISAFFVGIQEAIPEGAYVFLTYGVVALGLVAAGAFVLRYVRKMA